MEQTVQDNVVVQTPENEATPLTPLTPVKPLKTTKPAQSDKTIIKNLRAELKVLKETNEQLQEEVEVARNKAELYFQESQRYRKALDVAKERFSSASSVLFQTIDAGLKAFNMTR